MVPWFFGGSVLEAVFGIMDIHTKGELLESLCDRYSHLFNHWRRDGVQAASIEVGDGWFPILDVLSSILEGLNSSVQFELIKSDSGKLNVLISGGKNLGEIGAVVAAQFYSTCVCEFIGIPGFTRENNKEVRTSSPAMPETLSFKDGDLARYSEAPHLNEFIRPRLNKPGEQTKWTLRKSVII